MKYLLIIAFAAVNLFTKAHAQVKMPAPSPTQTIIQDFGLGKIELTYSRPGIKGRQLFGENSELVPLGKPWRTGANAATKIRFTDIVTIGDKTLDTGSYVIYTIPNKAQWDVVLSKGNAYPGAEGFKESDDVLHFKAPVGTLKDKIETFTMQFAKVKNESCELHLMWGNTDIILPVTTNIKERIRSGLEAALQGDKKPYYQAAGFYYDYDKNYAKALENINKATAENPKAYYMFLQKARIQKDMGDKAGAKESAMKTIELAKEEKNADYENFANQLLKQL
jgi:tetratricopeptide (TPR) repeat protein